MMETLKKTEGAYPTWAWPGGYPIYYLAADNGIMCPDCANSEDCDPEKLDADCPCDNQWRIVASNIHWEGGYIICENCSKGIESAYGEPVS